MRMAGGLHPRDVDRWSCPPWRPAGGLLNRRGKRIDPEPALRPERAGSDGAIRRSNKSTQGAKIIPEPQHPDLALLRFAHAAAFAAPPQPGQDTTWKAVLSNRNLISRGLQRGACPRNRRRQSRSSSPVEVGTQEEGGDIMHDFSPRIRPQLLVRRAGSYYPPSCILYRVFFPLLLFG